MARPGPATGQGPASSPSGGQVWGWWGQGSGGAAWGSLPCPAAETASVPAWRGCLEQLQTERDPGFLQTEAAWPSSKRLLVTTVGLLVSFIFLMNFSSFRIVDLIQGRQRN